MNSCSFRKTTETSVRSSPCRTWALQGSWGGTIRRFAMVCAVLREQLLLDRMTATDSQLLNRYAGERSRCLLRTRSGVARSQLFRRLRQVEGDNAAAADVAQAVFTDSWPQGLHFTTHTHRLVDAPAPGFRRRTPGDPKSVVDSAKQQAPRDE